MTRLFTIVLLFWIACTKGVLAQSSETVVWVQIEAQPTLAEALERIEDYALDLPDVNGFAMRGGWYSITLGPYLREDAELILQSYRATGRIPSDSYIAFNSSYQRQYWPEGADILSRGTVAIPSAAASEPPAPAPDTTATVTAPLDPDPESRADARRSESLLSRDEKRDLQTALRWAGFYNSSIDGSFGRGTRSAMAAWQSANGFNATGILTTRQRTALLESYNALLEGLDLQVVRDDTAGIQIKLPKALVKFERYEPPFAQYNPKQDETARVLLISQPGNRAALASLYEVMQSLEIVPLQGPRNLSRNSFTLVGRNQDFVSETRATLNDGEIKGFTLIWPTGDEDRRARVIAEMESSLILLPSVLDPALSNGATQSIDLIAGLELRKPASSRSGFYVNTNGAVVTTANAVQNCTRITLDDEHDATLSQLDAERGVAILRPSTRLAPPAFARFSETPPRLQTEIAVAGYSYEGQLMAPSVTFGKLSDVKGLAGETDLNRLSLDALPGDEGGPVFDDKGQVMGMLVPVPSGARQLPEEVRFALTSDAIRGVLSQAGLAASNGTETASVSPEDIAELGTGMTVLVSCWQ